MTALRIEKVTTPRMRQLIEHGGCLEMVTVLLNGNEVWRPQVRLPNDPEIIYHIMVYHTADTKYFKSLATAFEYFREVMPEEEIFSIQTRPVEEITTD